MTIIFIIHLHGIVKRRVKGFEWAWDHFESLFVSRKIDRGGVFTEKYLDAMAQPKIKNLLKHLMVLGSLGP